MKQSAHKAEAGMSGAAGSVGGSYVFLLRIWSDGGWRGRLQDLSSGQALGFDSWPDLVAAILAMLPVDGYEQKVEVQK